MCHYLYDTGELRGCEPEICDKKKVVSREEKKEYLKKLRIKLFNFPYRCTKKTGGMMIRLFRRMDERQLLGDLAVCVRWRKIRVFGMSICW